MLGQFLEWALPTPDLGRSLLFYQSLGFTITTATGDQHPHHAAVGDGRLTIGLYGSGLHAPALVFVRPGFSDHLARFADAGVQIDRVEGGSYAFHWLEGRLPGGIPVRVLEARTHSPPEPRLTALGWCDAVVVTHPDPVIGARHLEPLGFVALRADDGPGSECFLVRDDVTVLLKPHSSIGLPGAEFSCADPERLHQSLQLAGLLDRVQDGNLITPEGACLHIHLSD